MPEVKTNIRVAHMTNDPGMLNCHEGWLIIDLDKAADLTVQKKSVYKVEYPDTGETEMVPANELQLVGVNKNCAFRVIHKYIENGVEVKKEGLLIAKELCDKILVIHDGEILPVEAEAEAIEFI